MSRPSKVRMIVASSAACLVCGWSWKPRPSTATTGRKGAHNARMAAFWHGSKEKHVIVVTRHAHYDYRTSSRPHSDGAQT